MGTQEDANPIEIPGLRLHTGERVILCVLPSKWWTLSRYIFTLGLWAIWRQRHRYIVTSERVIVTSGIISTSEQSAPLSRIQDAHLHRSPLTGGRVELSTAGGQLGVNSITQLTRDDALKFADALTPLIGHHVSGVEAVR